MNNDLLDEYLLVLVFVLDQLDQSVFRPMSHTFFTEVII